MSLLESVRYCFIPAAPPAHLQLSNVSWLTISSLSSITAILI